VLDETRARARWAAAGVGTPRQSGRPAPGAAARSWMERARGRCCGSITGSQKRALGRNVELQVQAEALGCALVAPLCIGSEQSAPDENYMRRHENLNK
jgi:hypothetical protein